MDDIVVVGGSDFIAESVVAQDKDNNSLVELTVAVTEGFSRVFS